MPETTPAPASRPAPPETVAVSAVVSVFNEDESLDTLDAERREVLGGLEGGGEIVYVDDRSTDHSRQRIPPK